ncbi:uncharacterized protein LOC102621011 isoform X6 [Citrus sinensis]|nr:uncharacterized protein LOC102621011 isoform X6 [Citrus sinensis]
MIHLSVNHQLSSRKKTLMVTLQLLRCQIVYVPAACPSTKSCLPRFLLLAADAPIVGIIMESDLDLPVMNDAARTLSDFGVPYEIKILPPHQNCKEALSYALSAKERGIKIIIVGDGVEAHLSGVAAANSQILVIRVPLLSEDWSEDDVINSIRMPSHVQVASVPRNNAKNAALYAVKVLGIADEDLLERIRKYVEE